MVKIDHVAIWTHRLEELRIFYETYFQARSGEKYANPEKRFESYFLSFSSGVRIELMKKASMRELALPEDIDVPVAGYAHLAISVGSHETVDALTKRLEDDGYPVLDGPRHTGDGYYESVVLDPDGNRIEITI